jgi:hypothetical protein
MFFPQTKVTFLSSEVIDDEGFPSLRLSFNTTDKITLSMIDPERTLLFEEEYYQGIHEISIPLTTFRTSPAPGLYRVRVVDTNANEVATKKMVFEGSNLSCKQVIPNWWQEDITFVLSEVSLSVLNRGDLPVYPERGFFEMGSVSTSCRLLPTVVMPGRTAVIRCVPLLEEISSGVGFLDIEVEDAAGSVLCIFGVNVSPSAMVEDIVYRWTYLGQNTLRMPYPDVLYEYYQGLDRVVIDDYALYVFDFYDELYGDWLTERLGTLADSRIDEDLVNFVASFVQKMEYALDDEDDESCEYPRYPVDMLVDQQGDCEDKAILTASILDALGFNVSLLRLPNHMAVGVHLAEDAVPYPYYIKEYYYLETTRFPSPLGRIPPEYSGLTNITVHPISSRPILFHGWKNATRFTGTDGSDYVKIEIILENLGRTSAYDVEVSGAFYTQNGGALNQVTTMVSSVNVQEKTLVTFEVNVPREVSTILKTQIVWNSEVVHEKESSDSFP